MAGRQIAPILALLAGFITSCFLPLGCSKDPATLSDGDSGQFLVESDTFVLDYADSTEVVQHPDGVLELNYLGSDSLAIEQGYFLVAKNAAVLLRDILALSKSEHPSPDTLKPDTLRYILETGEATLSDVILNGELSSQEVLNPYTAYQTNPDAFDETALTGMTMTNEGILFTQVALVDSTIGETRLKATLTSGLLHFSPRMDFFARFLIDAGVKDTYALIEGDLDIAVDLEVEASDSVACAREIRLFGPIPFATLDLDNSGGLPLVMNVSFGLSADVEMTCSGPMTVDTHLEETISLEQGGRYRTSHDWTDVWNAQATVADYGLSYDVDEDIHLKLTLRPYFVTSIHGGAGATIETSVLMQFEGTATDSPWSWLLSQGIGGEWTYDLSRIDSGLTASSGQVDIDLETVAFDGAEHPTDVTPPARINDLTRAAADSFSVTLTWSAPGDNGFEGAAAGYDLRYSTWDQVLVRWEHSPQVLDESAPSPSGETDTLTISGLVPGTTYYFAARSIDDAENESATSNIVIARTLGQSVVSPPTALIPGGTYQMGDGNAPCGQDEHFVTLTRDFYIGQYEVTNLEYMELLQWAHDSRLISVVGTHVKDAQGSGRLLLDMTSDDCEIWFDVESDLFALRQSTFALREVFPDGYDPADHPVKRATWYGAVSYCNWLSLAGGYSPVYDPQTWTIPPGGTIYEAEGFRLPTDAEWEYVAQYESAGVYPWGSLAPSCELANCMVDNLWCVRWTMPVGSYPNGAQYNHEAPIHDLAGNLWEWCHDLWSCDLGAATTTDPTGPTTGGNRVLRGGSWSSETNMYRSAARSDFTSPDYPSFLVGFRIARTVTP